ncbi:MAG TPA: DUF4907 domain-containing protein [Bacteroidales bacterium]|nr:DUF4907 domain-containing protein [Bacteroidales bacterium]
MKIIKVSIIILLLVTLAAVVVFIVHKKNKKNRSVKTEVTLDTFQTSIGWGYKINVNKKTFIYQPFIPVIETHEGFESKELAERVGNLVIEKLKRKEMPSLTIEDLKQAGVKIHTNIPGNKITN